MNRNPSEAMPAKASPIHTLQIGNVSLSNNLILAPMAGVSDPPFRLLCREQGAGLVCMEMISAKALHYHNKKTIDLMKIEKAEHPVSLQLFGSDPDCMREVVAQIDEEPFDILDINMGCPVPKIVKGGDGSALMRNPKLAERVIRACVSSTKKPVTVKMRSGFDREHINAVELARVAEASGAAAVAVHGRTRDQMYSGKADWEIIRKVKESVAIPVLGNGDLDSPDAVKKMYEETGCDGFLIGRAAQGNPWIFHWILEAFEIEKKNHYPPSFEEVATMVLRHARMQTALRGEHLGMLQMRKHASWYVSGYPGAARMREAINVITTIEELEDLIKKIQ